MGQTIPGQSLSGWLLIHVRISMSTCSEYWTIYFAVCLPSFNVKSSAESDVVELNQCWCGQLMFTLHSFKDDRHAKWGSFGWMPPRWGEARASDFEELIQTLTENFNVCRMTLQHIILYARGLHKLTWVAGQIRVHFNISKVQ